LRGEGRWDKKTRGRPVTRKVQLGEKKKKTIISDQKLHGAPRDVSKRGGNGKKHAREERKSFLFIHLKEIVDEGGSTGADSLPREGGKGSHDLQLKKNSCGRRGKKGRCPGS